jgi:alpha-2-macroglobulin family protein/MG2 domain-containing protein/macroglobulin-like protein
MKQWRALFPLVVLLAVFSLAATGATTKKAPKKIRAVDTYVVGDQLFIPGSRASLRVLTKGVTGLTTSKPVPLARVSVSLVDQKKKEKALFSGRSDLLGISEVGFTVPDWPDGSYEMIVRTRTPFGKGEIKRSVTLKRSGKILMVTDKPIYQPGQLINMRALLLNSHSLKPLANEKVIFEVQDPKGNKVFKKRIKSNGFGIVSAQFQLADEINLGNYQIETLTENKKVADAASKTVVVKKYVLPKFKSQITTDKDFYLPKQTIKGKVQVDYFFGKPVAGGKVEIKAATFDVAFKEFATLSGRTDKNGNWEFELKLPDYFVGQPLQKGDAVVKLDIKVTDTAKHVEKSIKSVPVAATPIRLDAVPESGRLVAGVKNHIYVIATYPDGSPAKATVSMSRAKKQLGKTKTDETGLGFFVVTPNEKDMRQGSYQPTGSFGRDRRRFGGQQRYVYTKILDLNFEAKDDKGNSCKVAKSFSTDPAGDKILLRTDKAIYQAGQTLHGSVFTSSGGGTCYLDIIKNRQTLLTRSVPLSKGKGSFKFPLSLDVFGTIELHAYKILKSGEIMRDARVLYVHPPKELEITISRDKSVYRPGENALFKFRVADTKGKPAAAALGIIIVDEAVYALQELKPGLEKVYFTLEKELSKPIYQIEFGPAENLSSLVKAKNIQAKKQQVAKVLLAKAQPIGDPALWSNPVVERVQKAQNDRYVFQNALYSWGRQHPLGHKNPKGKWRYRKNLVAEMVKGKVLTEKQAKDPMGDDYTMKTVTELWPELQPQTYLAGQELNRLWNFRSYLYNELNRRTSGFTKMAKKNLKAELKEAFKTVIKQKHVAAKDLSGKNYRWQDLRKLPSFRPTDFVNQIHAYRVQRIYSALSRYGREGSRWYRVSTLDKKKNVYVFPKNVLKRVVKRGYLGKAEIVDIWGNPIKLRKLKEARKQVYYDTRLRFYLVYSIGPDGKQGSKDDLEYPYPVFDGGYQALAKAIGFEQAAQGGVLAILGANGGALDDMAMLEGAGGGFGGGGIGGLGTKGGRAGGRARPMRRMAKTATMAPPMATMAKEEPRADRKKRDSGPAAPKKRNVRVRSFFPETLLFAPAVITDAKGQASLSVAIADSITTWRMTASANSQQGGLGSISHGIRVFQDFFVDLDLPVALTQNDEVSIPVVVYNYLKTKQRVRLEMKEADWFVLSGGAVQEIELEPNEVSSTYYRIKVKGLGQKTLQVRADGSNMSDAIRREIEVRPDGKEQNLAANGRLEGSLTKTIDIPAVAVAGASKIIVRMYPGVFSQVIEGMESMLRLPGG